MCCIMVEENIAPPIADDIMRYNRDEREREREPEQSHYTSSRR
jgi:hypothetical protein